MIRVKNTTLSQNFADKPTAEIWASYHEMLLNESEAFGAKDGDLLTVKDALVQKFGEQSSEYSECRFHFSRLGVIDTPLAELTHERLLRLADTMLETPIRRGGSEKSETGIKKLPSPTTVIRKFAYLSSAINHLVKQGLDIKNETLKVIAYLKSKTIA